MSEKYRILCVCMGNICRSPTARALLQRQLRLTGLHEQVEVASAGTHDYHVGKPPDRRAQQALHVYGIDMTDDLSRTVTADDFLVHDEILAMDQHNLRHLSQLQPVNCRASVTLIMQELPDYGLSEVPDPFYGGEQGFVQVVDMLEQAAVAICQRLAPALNASSTAP
jgi:protein-tyrosine phosphatase